MKNEVALPRHIAIIMDGNGRWAKKRFMPRSVGHAQGAKVFLDCIDYAREIGLEAVTFYAFSTENWKRPQKEVQAIISLLRDNLVKIMKKAQKNTRVKILGDISPFPQDVIDDLRKVENETANNTGVTIAVALNYGGRADILHAVNQIATKIKSGEAFSIDEKSFGELLYTADMPEVDLMIRPSGEKRISNFLIWQSAYAELVFMDVLWPDFKKKHLLEAIEEFSLRNRRFGDVDKTDRIDDKEN